MNSLFSDFTLIFGGYILENAVENNLPLVCDNRYNNYLADKIFDPAHAII
jgi:hypothetical protein